MIYQKLITVVIGNRQFTVAPQNLVILILNIAFTICFRDIRENIVFLFIYELNKVNSVECKNNAAYILVSFRMVAIIFWWYFLVVSVHNIDSEK